MNDDLEERRAKERAFLATDIGRAFHKFKNAYGRAWRADTEFGCAADAAIRAERAAKNAWAQADEAETEFRKLLEGLMSTLSKPPATPATP